MVLEQKCRPFRRFWCNYLTGTVVEVTDFADGARTHADELGIPAEVQAKFTEYTPLRSRGLCELLFRSTPLGRWQWGPCDLRAEFCAEDDAPLLRCMADFGRKEQFPPDLMVHLTNDFKLQRRHCRWCDFPGEVR